MINKEEKRKEVNRWQLQIFFEGGADINGRRVVPHSYLMNKTMWRLFHA